MSVGMPVVAFEKSGGVPELLSERSIGRVVPYGDVPAMVKALEEEMVSDALDAPAAQARRKLMAEEFVWDDYVADLLKLALPDLRRVSVTVPNYNYARYMPERLGSIFGQAYPVSEVIVLDDCSKDDSLEAIGRVAAEWHRDVRLLANAVNSGSVFAQWRKAAEEATGEFVWIAEADDVSDPTFISKLVDLLRSDPEIRFAFSDSRSVDSDGKPLGPSYKPYYATVEPGALEHTEVFDAVDFVQRFLSVKNLILNVSAVVWRRDALLRALDRCGAELKEYRMAGDWRLYLEALAEPGARIAYEAEPLNVHRRHAQSVTHALKADLHVAEIDRIQGMAAQAFSLPPAAVATQRAYLEEVAVQLGGRLPERPTPPRRSRRIARPRRRPPPTEQRQPFRIRRVSIMYMLPPNVLLENLGLTPEQFRDSQHVTVPTPLLKFLLQAALLQSDFDEKSYLEANPDVAEAVRRGRVKSGRVHYVTTGYLECRSGGHPAVDEGWYLSTYQDVGKAVRRRRSTLPLCTLRRLELGNFGRQPQAT